MRRTAIAFLALAFVAACAPRPTPAPTPLPSPTATPSPTPTPEPTPTPVIYIVQSGDTLSKIAALYGTTADAICSLNTLKDCGRIFRGQALTIPGQVVAALTPTASPPTPSPAPTEAVATLPPPQDLGPVDAGGNAQLEIDNDTPYDLLLEFQGPTSHAVSVERCPDCKEYYSAPLACPSKRPSATFTLTPGTYTIRAQVDRAGIVPFFGTWELVGNRSYGYCLFIVTQLQ